MDVNPRRATELPGHDQQHLVPHAALFEVLDQRADGLIELRAPLFHNGEDIAVYGVVVPADHRLVIIAATVGRKSNGHHIHSGFHQTASEQTLLPRQVQSIALAHLRPLAGEVERSRCRATREQLHRLLPKTVHGTKLLERGDRPGLALVQPVEFGQDLQTLVKSVGTAARLQILNDEARFGRIAGHLKRGMERSEKCRSATVQAARDVNVSGQRAMTVAARRRARLSHAARQPRVGGSANQNLGGFLAAPHPADHRRQVRVSRLASFRFAVPSGEHIVRTDDVIRRRLMQRTNHARSIRQRGQSRQYFAVCYARQRR